MSYLHWNQQTITDFSAENVERMYADGYVFTRLGKGVMHQTRSARIDLSKFELSSENRRILKKCENLDITSIPLPLSKGESERGLSYDWQIGKMAKDFYKLRNADFSANKVKELITDPKKSNFNSLLIYSGQTTVNEFMGYVIGFETKNIFHYSYPFYDLALPRDTGLGMMLLAIQRSKSEGQKFFYLGSLQRPSDSYKLQFAGFEWFTPSNTEGFDGKEWQTDIEKAKQILNL